MLCMTLTCQKFLQVILNLILNIPFQPWLTQALGHTGHPHGLRSKMMLIEHVTIQIVHRHTDLPVKVEKKYPRSPAIQRAWNQDNDEVDEESLQTLSSGSPDGINGNKPPLPPGYDTNPKPPPRSRPRSW